VPSPIPGTAAPAGANVVRARQAGAAPEGARAGDLLTLVYAIAWADDQAPEDEGLLDLLLFPAGLSLPPEPGRSCPGRW
jgi:hypothetical protein